MEEEAHAVSSRRNKNILLRLWSGDVRLVITFWVFGVLASAVIGVALVIVSISLRLPSLVYIIGFPVLVFQSVAIWRSAKKYQGEVLIRKLAQMAVAIGVLFSMLNLLAFIVGVPSPG